jgi:hypothetical protein
MYSNKLNLKFFKLILFSEKMQFYIKSTWKKKLKTVWDSNTRHAVLRPAQDFFLMYGDVTGADEGLHNLGLCSALSEYEQGWIFIVPHLLWQRTSVFPVSSKGQPLSVASYDTQMDRLIICGFTSRSRIGHLLVHWNMETSPLPVKGCKLWAYARHSGPLSREGYLSYHTNSDTGPRFLRFHACA